MMMMPVKRMRDLLMPFSKSFTPELIQTLGAVSYTHLDVYKRQVDAQENETCGKCEEGSLQSLKSIEVGHIFLLGNKYSKPLSVKFVDKENKNDAFVHMGCYGIGVSRLVGAVAELGRDANGFRWPAIMAPYKLSICTGPNNEENSQRARNIVSDLLNNSSMHLENEILNQFNEKLGIGARIKLSHAMGVPCLLYTSRCV